MSIIASRQLGKFELTPELINENPDVVMLVMGTCIVLECTASFVKNSLCYIAISPAFEELEEGMEIPSYDVAYDEDTNEVSWEREA